MFRSSKHSWSVAWLLVPGLLPPIPPIVGWLAGLAGAPVHLHSLWGVVSVLGFGLTLLVSMVVLLPAVVFSARALIVIPENRSPLNVAALVGAGAIVAGYLWYLVP